MFGKYLKPKVNLVIFICILFIQGITSYKCFKCQGTDCQKEVKLKDTVKCEDEMDDCVSVFGESKILERGCYSTLPEPYRQQCDEYDNTKCHRCFEDNCNDQGPTKCIQCNSKDNWNCFNSPQEIESSYCPITVRAQNLCYVRYNTVGYMERGCVSSEQEVTKCHDSYFCEMCEPKDGLACNTKFTSITAGSSQRKIYITAGSSQRKIYGALIAVAIFVGLNC